MSSTLGLLVPVGGGDPIPMIHEIMSVGRRDSCDICLKFHNISAVHCEFAFRSGVWHIRDMNSTNGIKVKGVRTLARALNPGDEVAIAGHKYVIHYQLPAGVNLDELNDEDDNIFGQSLMEKAGLTKSRSNRD